MLNYNTYNNVTKTFNIHDKYKQRKSGKSSLSFTYGCVHLKIPCPYLETLLFGHTFCSMLSKLNEYNYIMYCFLKVWLKSKTLSILVKRYRQIIFNQLKVVVGAKHFF